MEDNLNFKGNGRRPQVVDKWKTTLILRCGQQYIGQTSRSLRERFSQLCGHVDRNTEATGRHFNLPGHSKSYMSVTVIEKIHSPSVWVREEIESKHIRRANKLCMGINLKPWAWHFSASTQACFPFSYTILYYDLDCNMLKLMFISNPMGPTKNQC
jgi:hypothetical protein